MITRELDIELRTRDKLPARYRNIIRLAAQAASRAIPPRAWRACVPAGTRAEVSIATVGAATMRRLNRDHRGRDRATDVLSFPAPPVPGSVFIGDIVLSWAVARRQCGKFSTTPRQELQRLVVHGMLHLFHYDHETGPSQARTMFRLQERILKSL